MTIYRLVEGKFKPSFIVSRHDVHIIMSYLKQFDPKNTYMAC